MEETKYNTKNIYIETKESRGRGTKELKRDDRTNIDRK